MADDERRAYQAEIEAVAREANPAFDVVGKNHYLREAERYINAVDRVRDARGDDEAVRRIAEYDVKANHGHIDEWTQAEAFENVQQIARDAVRDARGDDEPEQKWQLWLNAAERDVVLSMRRSPHGEES